MGTPRTVLLALALVAVTGACTDVPPLPPVANATATPSSTAPAATARPSAGGSPTCTPAFPANTARDDSRESGEPLGLQSVTTGAQPGYDRVVYRFAGGTGVPGWRVEYDDAPASDGSGDPVEVAGDATLRVVLTGVGLPGDTGVPEPTPRRSTPAGTAAIREVVLQTLFEGQWTTYIGVDGKLPFRAFALDKPTRVVVDVRTC